MLVYLAVEGGVHARDNLAALRSTLAYLRQALEVQEKGIILDEQNSRTVSSEQHSPQPSPSGRGSQNLPSSGGQKPYLLIERDTLSFNTEADFEGDWLTLQTT